jgi:hypothetical protein
MNFRAGCAGENPDSGNQETGVQIRISRKSPGIFSMNEKESCERRVQMWQAASPIGDVPSKEDERKRYP